MGSPVFLFYIFWFKDVKDFCCWLSCYARSSACSLVAGIFWFCLDHLCKIRLQSRPVSDLVMSGLCSSWVSAACLCAYWPADCRFFHQAIGSWSLHYLQGSVYVVVSAFAYLVVCCVFQLCPLVTHWGGAQSWQKDGVDGKVPNSWIRVAAGRWLRVGGWCRRRQGRNPGKTQSFSLQGFFVQVLLVLTINN